MVASACMPHVNATTRDFTALTLSRECGLDHERATTGTIAPVASIRDDALAKICVAFIMANDGLRKTAGTKQSANCNAHQSMGMVACAASNGVGRLTGAYPK
ncbi:hypothetical protein DWV00_01800 [Trinickia dinghuensis]|uniref:Uncharacterized protein n=1 Tax=Trinickia dinghuensis TaxID=2291023 RepID=A0A3D8K6L8_9BURK|nr:hypothetical protein DWV00_01800 [Trinickia dinghuensis]